MLALAHSSRRSLVAPSLRALFRPQSTHSGSSTFYGLNPSSSGPSSSSSSIPISVRGEVVDVGVNLQNARPGDVIEVPYELTVTEGIKEFWAGAFYCHDRISTSTPFARKLGLQDQVLPFSLMLFLTGSMSHADSAKVQVSFQNAVYHWPAFPGDTFTKSFRVRSVRNTASGNNSIISFDCRLVNQRGRTVMSTDKSMMFDFRSPQGSGPAVTYPQSSVDESSVHGASYHTHLLSKSSVLADLGSHSLKPLRPGQLLLHTMCRSLSMHQMGQLSSLARLTHERHFNALKYDPSTQLFVPGGQVLGLACSAAARDLHEVLYESLGSVSFTNNVHPGDTVGAFSFVKHVAETASGDMEAIDVVTVGVKNVDVVCALAGKEIPTSLFYKDRREGNKQGMLFTRKDVEKICRENVGMDVLMDKIVLVAERRIVRQAAKYQAFLL